MSVTAAYTSTTFTPDVNCGAADSVPMSTVVSRMVESAHLVKRKGFTMFGRLGIPELIIILAIIILIFGANRLPEIGRGIGKGIKNFKDSTREGQNDGKA